jgi:uncharacterized RDD family membrane protein YckC
MTKSADRASQRPYLLPQGVFMRAVAFFIDSFLTALVAFWVMSFAGFEAPAPPSVLDSAATRDYLSTDAGFTLTLVTYGALLVYAAVAEGVWGRTLGKYLLGLEVVRARDGDPCGWRGALIRSLLRPLDLVFLGMPGALLVMVSRRRQRLGDILGGTLVVRRLPALPSFAGMPMPRVLRRCDGCSGLVEAAGGCEACARPPATGDVPQPIAVMMAVGQAAAGFTTAVKELLAAEDDFRRASSDEYDRLEQRESAAGDSRVEESESAAGEDRLGERDDTAGDDRLESGAPTAGDGLETSEAESTPSPAEPALEYSEGYITAWNALLEAARTLHRRYSLFEEAARQAGLRMDQAVVMQPELGRWADELEEYLKAESDEDVFEAFSSRALSAPSA